MYLAIVVNKARNKFVSVPKRNAVLKQRNICLSEFEEFNVPVDPRLYIPFQKSNTIRLEREKK